MPDFIVELCHVILQRTICTFTNSTPGSPRTRTICKPYLKILLLHVNWVLCEIRVMSKNNKRIYIILHNIRSTHNVGAIFRTADALGISKIFLTGYTPTPLDRFGKERQDVGKAALGAEKTVPWEQVKNLSLLLKKLRVQGVQIIAVEQSTKAIDYKKIKVTSPTAFIFGNEVSGLSKMVLEKCDRIAEIPMRGEKESLNVSVSVGVALFRILNV